MFSRIDICEAWYLYAYLYHDGQGSKLYQIFGRLDRIGFRQSPLLTEASLQREDRENVKEIFSSLVSRKVYQNG
jgi:hypothetical protein